MIATVHGNTNFGLPLIAVINPDFETFSKLVAHLQAGFLFSLTRKELTEVWSNSNGNFRQAFSVLYDLYEQQTNYKKPSCHAHLRSLIHSQHSSIASSSGRRE